MPIYIKCVEFNIRSLLRFWKGLVLIHRLTWRELSLRIQHKWTLSLMSQVFFPSKIQEILGSHFIIQIYLYNFYITMFVDNLSRAATQTNIRWFLIRPVGVITKRWIFIRSFGSFPFLQQWLLCSENIWGWPL